MFEELEHITRRPELFSDYTADRLWTDAHTSKHMLHYHLAPELDMASRNHRFISQAVDWLSKEFSIGPQTRVADFGCGPGLISLPLAQGGAKVTGIDFSPRSLGYARRAAEEARVSIDYVECNYHDFESERCFDLILLFMCDFCALAPQQRHRLLQTFRRHLTPSGAVVFDVYGLAAYAMREEASCWEKNLLDGFWSPDPYFGFHHTFKYEREKVILDKYDIITKGKHETILNWLAYFSPESLTDELARADLHPERFLGNIAGAPYAPTNEEFAVIARPGC